MFTDKRVYLNNGMFAGWLINESKNSIVVLKRNSKVEFKRIKTVSKNSCFVCNRNRKINHDG